MEIATRNKLAELFFDIKKNIPDGKYIEFMDILGKREKERDFEDVKIVKLKYRLMSLPHPSLIITNPMALLDVDQKVALLQVVPSHEDDEWFEKWFYDKEKVDDASRFYNHHKFLEETGEISQKKLQLMDAFTNKTCNCLECKIMRMPNQREIIEPLCIEIVA